MPALSNARHDRFYVYTLSCPESGKPFYVGKGTGKRRFAHEREAKNKDLPPTKKRDFIRSLLARGLRPVVAIVVDNLTETAALINERELIRRIGYANLTNILPGSENETTRAYRDSKDMLSRLKTEDMIRAEGDWWNGAKLEFRLHHRNIVEQQLVELCGMLEAQIKGQEINYASPRS